MDRIIINELEVFYHIGVPDEERARPQRLLLTIEIFHDFSAAAQMDEIAETINYFSVSQRLLRFGENKSWKLIETLAVEIAAVLKSEFRIQKISVEVKKFIIPQARHIAVKIER
jgi:FolB domain-containing protein